MEHEEPIEHDRAKRVREDMNGSRLQTDHPVDALPEYVRGDSPDAHAIERHLAACETCRLEVEVLTALRESRPSPLSDIEIERTYRGFAARRLVARPAWLVTAWRVAAGVALLLTSVAVVRVVQERSPADWDPDAAIQGWVEDLADLDLPAPEMRLALGVSLLDDAALGLPWEDLEDVEVGELPWENER